MRTIDDSSGNKETEVRTVRSDGNGSYYESNNYDTESNSNTSARESNNYDSTEESSSGSDSDNDAKRDQVISETHPPTSSSTTSTSSPTSSSTSSGTKTTNHSSTSSGNKETEDAYDSSTTPTVDKDGNKASTSYDSYDGNNVDTSGPLPEGVYEVFREAHFAYQREQAAKREKDREQRVQRECVWDALVKKMIREATSSTTYSTYDNNSSSDGTIDADRDDHSSDNHSD